MMQIKAALPEISVFISSPGDTKKERAAVKRVIQEINMDPAWTSRCTIKPLAYESSVPTQLGKPAQRVVNDFMRKSAEADIVLCILCNRLGTPTRDEQTGRDYRSGTQYELETALEAFQASDQRAPRIMLYLGDRGLHRTSSDDDLKQYNIAREFKRSILNGERFQGLYAEYKTISELADMIRRQLPQHLHSILAEREPDDEAPPGASAYLGRLAEKFCWLNLDGIQEAGSVRIELEKVYVALKAEPETEYDLQQASALHDVEVREAAGVYNTDVIDPEQLAAFDAANIRRTYRLARQEAKRALVAEVRTVADAVRQHRRVVILGGPGSGKTTLGRWLALQLAYALLSAPDTDSPPCVNVPLPQVDPDADIASPETVNLGPARLPIFLRLAHYARELTERERAHQPSLPLIEYLGLDPDTRGLSDGLTAEARQELFHFHLKKRQAVVILDGLDELTQTNRRGVVLQIEDFIKDHIRAAGTGKDSLPPSEVGGNQVIVTSRYVGYKFAPVKAECTHFGIQPMRRPSVERFVHALTPILNAERPMKDGTTDRLIAEIYSASKPRIRELATNPLLITILAIVYWRDGKLPDQRAGVYDRVVENLVEIWRKREECQVHHLTREELLAALEPLAYEMQENASGNSLVSLTRIGEVIENAFAQMASTDRPFHPRLNALLSTLPKHVGLLAEQSDGNYAFFHRTFQEFLAARHLLAKPEEAAAQISEKMDDPIWREPLLLALGLAMIKWGPERQNRLLKDLLAVDAPGEPIPRAAFLLATALPELRNLPDAVVEQTALRLLAAYAINLEQTQARELGEQIEQMFQRLRQSPQADLVARAIAECIGRAANGRDLAGAAATLATRIGWFTTELVEAVLGAMHRDLADLDYPIYHAALTAFGRQPGISWLAASPAHSITRLLRTRLPMRYFLESRPDLVTFIRDDSDWLCLLAALYGGFEQAPTPKEIKREQQREVAAARAGSARVSVPMAPAPPILAIPELSVVFSPQFIVRDLADRELGRLIERQLAASKPACDLLNAFRRRWEAGADAGAAEALIGMAALGEDILPLLRAGLGRTDREPAAKAALTRFGWLRAALREPVLQTAEAALRSLPEEAPEQCQLDLLRIVLRTRIEAGGAPLPVSSDIPEFNYLNTETASTSGAVGAEYWSYMFSGAIGDGSAPESRAALLAALAAWPCDRLLQAWSVLPDAANRSAAGHLPWPLLALTPRADSPVERYLAMLEAMASVPAEYHSIAGYVLAQCAPVLEVHPTLVWETLAVNWRHGGEFIRGYRKFREGRREDSAKAREFLDPWLRSRLAMSEVPDEADPRFSWLRLFQEMSAILDPYLRFRAQWRLLDVLLSEEEGVEFDVIGLLEQISDPDNQLRAFEWLLTTLPRAATGLVDYLGIMDLLLTILGQIADPENRARASCRLALLTSRHFEQLLSGAAEAVRAIANPARKAATIREIQIVWGGTPDLANALNEAAQTIAEPWERDKALGRDSRMVRKFHHHHPTSPLVWRLPQRSCSGARAFRQGNQHGALPWTLLYLELTAAEAQALGTGATRGVVLWERLLDSDPAAALAAIAASGREVGVPVTAHGAWILDRIVQSGRAANFDGLWPYLVRPDPGAMVTIARWTALPGRAGQWSALVQAEAGVLTPAVVNSVIELLTTATDMLHLRASLALHGPTPYVQNPNRRWIISRVGAETLEALAAQAIQLASLPAARTTMDWVQGDIHHDDPAAIAAWLRQADSGGESSPAAWLLRMAQSANADVVHTLLSALRAAPAGIQRTLLFGLARIARCSPNSFTGKDIHLAVASVPPEIRAGVVVLPEGPATFLKIAKEAVEAASSANAASHARRMLDSCLIWLDEPSLVDRDTCLKRLKAIGDQLFVQLGSVESRGNSYWSTAEKAAAPLATDGRILPLLLALLEEAELGADPYGHSHNHHLLTAIEAISRFSPEGFGVIASPEIWEPVLIEWAEYGDHWAGRMAATRLVGRLRRVTTRVARCLKAAMGDVSFVQQAAYASVAEFRRLDGDILPELLSLIDNPNAGTAAATTRLLVSIAQADIAPADRRRILRSLQQEVARPSTARPVYLMEDEAGAMSIKFIDTLDRLLYRAIFQVSGL